VALAPRSLGVVERAGVTYVRFSPEIEKHMCFTVGLARRSDESCEAVLTAAAIIASLARERMSSVQDADENTQPHGY
jgi:hypothetical protein